MNIFKSIGKVTGAISGALVEYAETIEDSGKLIHNEVTALIKDQVNDMALADVQREADFKAKCLELGIELPKTVVIEHKS